MRTSNISFIGLILLSSLGIACSSPASEDATNSSESDLISGRVGAVYTMSNAADSNEILVFRRAADGSLQAAASYATTGKGSGAALGSEGSITLSADRQWLFAVDAGSNDLAVFYVHGETLYLVDSISTGGIQPISVTEFGGVVYVAHAGGTNNITGFVQRNDGTLKPLAGSTRSLSAASVGVAEVAFTPDGSALIVTEKGTNSIDEFPIDPYTGKPGAITTYPSNGATPFGFAITNRDQVLVSEAVGGAANASTVSSYAADGLTTISASIADTQSAACWVTLSTTGRTAYVSNTGSGTISAYQVASSGALTLIGSGVSGTTGDGSKPTDMAVSRNDGFLYVVDSATSAIGVQRIHADGSLTALADVTGLPATVVGLAAQ